MAELRRVVGEGKRTSEGEREKKQKKKKRETEGKKEEKEEGGRNYEAEAGNKEEEIWFIPLDLVAQKTRHTRI